MLDTYYPIATGNYWKYDMKSGNSFSNTITEVGENYYVAVNSKDNTTYNIKLENGNHYSDAYELGNPQIVFKDNLIPFDAWQIKYKANAIDCILDMKVSGIEAQKIVDGKTYENVIMIEGSSSFSMNGILIPANMKTQYYYAKNIGQILITSSSGDYFPLIEYKLM